MRPLARLPTPNPRSSNHRQATNGIAAQVKLANCINRVRSGSNAAERRVCGAATIRKVAGSLSPRMHAHIGAPRNRKPEEVGPGVTRCGSIRVWVVSLERVVPLRPRTSASRGRIVRCLIRDFGPSGVHDSKCSSRIVVVDLRQTRRVRIGEWIPPDICVVVVAESSGPAAGVNQCLFRIFTIIVAKKAIIMITAARRERSRARSCCSVMYLSMP